MYEITLIILISFNLIVTGLTLAVQAGLFDSFIYRMSRNKRIGIAFPEEPEWGDKITGYICAGCATVYRDLSVEECDKCISCGQLEPLYD